MSCASSCSRPGARARIGASCAIGAAPDAEIAIVERRTLAATWLIVAGAFAAIGALAIAGTAAALLPAAFVLGWLNLAGL